MPPLQSAPPGGHQCTIRRSSLPWVLFPQTSLSPIFQLCAFQFRDQPVELVSIAHKSICIFTLGHLSLHTNCITRCNAQSSAYYNDLSSLVSSEPPLGGAIVQLSIFSLCQYTESTHLWAKLGIFPLSAGHGGYPMRPQVWADEDALVGG